MRIYIDRSQLLKSLSRVHRVVERRNTIPILSNILIDGEGDQVLFKATDLDLEVTETVLSDVEQMGSTTIPAHLLYDIVRKLPDGGQIMLNLEADGHGVTIVSGKANFRLQALPKTDFPQLSAGEFSHKFKLSSASLKYLIDCTQFAVSTEETRYYLNGIYLHVIEDGDLKLRAVATDGHRLAQAQISAPIGAEGMNGIIIPRKSVGEIQKLLAEEPDAEVEVELSDSKIRISLGRVVLTSKLIDGTFPEYQRVIPLHNDKILTIDRSQFASAVDRVSTISMDKGRAVKLQISQDRLVLSVNNPESGSAEDELLGQYDSEDIEIGFNSKYLLDVMAQLSGDEAVFSFADSGAPTLIRDKDGQDALYVLMPMRV